MLAMHRTLDAGSSCYKAVELGGMPDMVWEALGEYCTRLHSSSLAVVSDGPENSHFDKT